MKGHFSFKLLIFFFAFLSHSALAEQPVGLFELTLEQLLQTKVRTVSGIDEKIHKAPAAILVISATDIKVRGYTDITQVLADLPGFDIRIVNGSQYATAQARGHTNIASTLFMIDGIVENTLWDLSPVFSRQYPMANIKQIEVSYGPGSAVHGANALAAVVNIITYSGQESSDKQHQFNAQASLGEFNTKSFELGGRGRSGAWYYAVSARSFKSDEANFSNPSNFLNNELYSNRQIWGPLLDIKQDGLALGQYADPSKDWGIIAKVGYGNTRLTLNSWQTSEGYGPAYAADRAQNNVLWQNSSQQLFLENDYQYSAKLKLKSLLLYRESRIWGNWAEASPDTITPDINQSLISYTQFNTLSHSTLFKEKFEYQLNPSIHLNGGLQYERKRLSKGYDAPGYYGAYSSTVPNDQTGPLGFGAAVFHSSSESYTLVPFPVKDTPNENLRTTTDKGGYIQAIIDSGDWRYHLGYRYDRNSIYGNSNNPRLSAIYTIDSNSRIKFSYQEAFLEPSALTLFGSFGDRNAAPNRKPEETKNVEIIYQLEKEHWNHDISIYHARYINSVRLEQVVDHETRGIEYRGRYQWKGLAGPVENISGYAYYTYTDSQVELDLLPILNIDSIGKIDTGGSAPHKLRVGITLGFNQQWSLNLRGIYDSEQDYLIGHSYRIRGDKAPSTTQVAATLNYDQNNWFARLKIINLLDKENTQAYLAESHAGDNYANRSQGLINPHIPLPERALYLQFGYRFNH